MFCPTGIDLQPSMAHNGPMTATERFLPSLTMTDADEAREAYFALAARAQVLTATLVDGLSNMSSERVRELRARVVVVNRLAGDCLAEWQRLTEPA